MVYLKTPEQQLPQILEPETLPHKKPLCAYPFYISPLPVYTSSLMHSLGCLWVLTHQCVHTLIFPDSSSLLPPPAAYPHLHSCSRLHSLLSPPGAELLPSTECKYSWFCWTYWIMFGFLSLNFRTNGWNNLSFSKAALVCVCACAHTCARGRNCTSIRGGPPEMDHLSSRCANSLSS